MFTLFTSIYINETNFTIRENYLLNHHNVSKTCSIRDGIHHLPFAVITKLRLNQCALIN